MKKRFFAIFLATILFAGLSITCPAESADFVQTEPLPPFDGAENLVPNPGFEELNEEGLPIGWANKEKAKIDDEFAHSGRYSMKVTTTGDGAVAYAAVNFCIHGSDPFDRWLCRKRGCGPAGRRQSWFCAWQGFKISL